MKKNKLTEEEAHLALRMLNSNVPIGQVAKRYRTNKPGILKTTQMWKESEVKTSPDGREYKIVRGRAVFRKEVEKARDASSCLDKGYEVKEGAGFEVK